MTVSEAIDNIHYFVNEWLSPVDTDLTRIGLRLANLDQLLMEAKFALDGEEAKERAYQDSLLPPPPLMRPMRPPHTQQSVDSLLDGI